jgi:radical SAM/Cys-rich protein
VTVGTAIQGNAFAAKVVAVREAPLRALELTTLQVNLGYRCNLACKHCHVGGGPARTEMMDRETVDAVLHALARSNVGSLDLTGGAPEMNPHFRDLVREAGTIGKKVIVRTNLAVLSENSMIDLPQFFQDNDVDVVASLPYYLEDDVDRVRGNGTFRKCVAALRQLNSLGFGLTNGKVLNLVYNPRGAFLAPDQASLEAEYRKELLARFGISFTRLFTFTNMPIGRFRDFLTRTGNLEKYQDKLACAFNPATLDGIMCRHLVSVGWDGRLYDCDFNHVLGLAVNSGAPSHIRDFDQGTLARRSIETGDHCFGCTAGAGSS